MLKSEEPLYPAGNYLMQYEGTYRFNAVANAVPAGGGLPSISLEMGQITARGLLYTDPNRDPIPPIRFPITGGTDFYRLARGEITERTPAPIRGCSISGYSRHRLLLRKSFCADGDSVPACEHQPE